MAVVEVVLVMGLGVANVLGSGMCEVVVIELLVQVSVIEEEAKSESSAPKSKRLQVTLLRHETASPTLVTNAGHR